MRLTRRGFIEAVTFPRPLPGTSVGPTTPAPENVIGYAIDNFGSVPRLLPAFAPGPNVPSAVERASWGWVDNDIKSDLRRALEYLNRAMRGPHPRPDLIVIDGVGYGKDDPLPPPFGSGT